MHGSAGLHSAMAIKRQRRIREQAKRRAAERRLSSRTNSMDSMEHNYQRRGSFHPSKDQVLATSIGMLHIGVCFLVLGLFLMGSGLLPDDVVSWRGVGWWNELVITGIFVTVLGIFLIALNKVMLRKEEDELQDYVARQLTRSRSGHRLERDVETGCLTTKNHRKMLEKQREDKQKGTGTGTELITPTHSPHTKLAPANAINGDAYLEKILEEEGEECKRLELKETISQTTTASLSPGSPSETRELIVNGRQYSFNSRQY